MNDRDWMMAFAAMNTGLVTLKVTISSGLLDLSVGNHGIGLSMHYDLMHADTAWSRMRASCLALWPDAAFPPAAGFN